VDFVCREAKLVVEVDGATHSTPAELESDASRTAYLHSQGQRVIRLQNSEVLHGMDQVVAMIEEALTKLPSPSPSLRAGPPSSPAGGRGYTRLRSLPFGEGEVSLQSSGTSKGKRSIRSRTR
jgi:hypothetical protein